ncbi:ABC transporter substrate-binding protein [Colidextribacter sp. OB.20]|uniref:substrate-binding domain-containing protein n=1 Tax=Colidextribacter sp. OB.20 TaxID=2304568 RepID=UPI00136B9D53|nr:substrate-binding domain-containing protein [Colidextribacter sp. OB.20]NBI09782.1 ABC transporter substrate-binding protein [Colidextribacter sp. OB.20]
MKKRVLSMILAASMMLALAACGGNGGNGDKSNTQQPPPPSSSGSQQQSGGSTSEPPAASPVAGKKVAYIMIMPSATIFQMWANSCKDLASALGASCDVFFCDGDFNKWQDTIRTCAAGGYDGLLVSHGNQDGSYVFLKEITEQYPNLKITCFDTQFYADGEYQKIEGVTQMFQQDASLVTVLLDDMIKNFGEGVRLIKVWRGPNYNSPFDRREVGWQEYQNAGKIVTVGEVQPLQDTVDSANTVFAAYLQSIKREDVDGAVVYYDCYGQGVYQAIVENANFNGTNGDPLPMGSVDIDPVDVTNMLTRPDIWTAAGTTDWTLNGEIGMRILMLEIAGEYDKIYDPASGKTGVDVVEVPGSAILASALKPTSTVENLGEIADETYGNLNYLSVADWMPADLLHK